MAGGVADATAAGFTWAPLVGSVACADDLPHRICQPLGLAQGGGPTALAALHEVEPTQEAVQEDAPDLQGFALAPMPFNAAGSQISPPDAVLVR